MVWLSGLIEDGAPSMADDAAFAEDEPTAGEPIPAPANDRRERYVEALLRGVEGMLAEGREPSGELLDRIERLVGVP